MNSKKVNMFMNVVILIGLAYLLIMPIYSYVQYIKLYYFAIIFIVIPTIIYQLTEFKKVQRRFYKRWGKTREKGKPLATAVEALRIFIFTNTIMLSIQFIISGNSPLAIIEQFLSSQNIIPVLILLVIYWIVGASNWRSNEKRYHNIKKDKI